MALRFFELIVRHARVLQVATFVVILGGYFLGGAQVGKGTLGICLIVGAVLQQCAGKVPYGWEGAEPSGYLTGWKVLLFNLALVAAGVYFMLAAWVGISRP